MRWFRSGKGRSEAYFSPNSRAKAPRNGALLETLESRLLLSHTPSEAVLFAASTATAKFSPKALGTISNPGLALNAGPSSTDAVQLSWTSLLNGQTGYEVLRRNGRSGAYKEVASVGADATTFTDSGLRPNAKYSYEIVALNGRAGIASANALVATLPVPAAPSNVKAAVSSSDVHLTWSETSPNATGFTILQMVPGSRKWNIAGTVSGATTSYDATNLQPNAVYRYRVEALSDRVTSRPSLTVTARTAPLTLEPVSSNLDLSQTTSPDAVSSAYTYTDSSKSVSTKGPKKTGGGKKIGLTTSSTPNAPSNLTTIAGSSTSVQLSWSDDLVNETGFEIEREISGSGLWTVISTTDAVTTNYTDTSAASGTAYTYQVFAVNGSVWSQGSNTAAVTTPPVAPTGLAASATSDSTVQLAWSDNAGDESGFEIDRQVANSGVWNIVTTLPATTTSYLDQQLTADTTYSYRVMATQGSVLSSPSAMATTVTWPAAPSNLAITSDTPTSINLSWSSSSTGLTGFTVERQTANSGTWDILGTIPANTTSYQDSGLTSGTLYSYEVVASNQDGTSSPSNVVSAVTPPSAPTNVSANALGADSVQISWTDNAGDNTGFKIARSTDGVHFTTVGTVSSATNTYTDTGLTAQTTYYYLVAATNTGGDTPSAIASATTLASSTTSTSAPNAPTLTTASPFSAARIDLGWKDNSSNESDFVVQESTDGTTFSTIATLAANTTTYSVTGLQPATQYFFRVEAENGTGSGVSAVLGGQTLQNVTVGGDGWTTIVPSADSRIIYVSSSTGNDNNSGLSPDSPVQTIAKGESLMRNGYPDWLLLKRGDTFTTSDLPGSGTTVVNWNLSGRSATEPDVLGAYGTGARPTVDTVIGGTALEIGYTRSNIAVIGIDFTSSERDPASPNYNANAGATQGLFLLAGQNGAGDISNFLIEDCQFTYFTNGVIAESMTSAAIHNLTIRRSLIANSYSPTSAHSEGIYTSNVNGLVLDQNVIDHNGWNSTVAGAGPTVFNHDIYLDSTNSNVVVRGNTIANASSHGLQARAGGDIENNVFINDPIGMSFGYVNGSSLTPGGVSGSIAGNVFIGDRDIAGSARGWAIEVSNTKPGGGTVIENNVFTGDTQNAYAAIRLDFGTVDNPDQGVGINDLTIRNNTIDGWSSAIWISSSAVLGGTGQYALNGLVVSNNDFQNVLSGVIADAGPAYNGQAETWAGNRYWSSGDVSQWFSVNGANTSWSTWNSNVDATGTQVQVTYPDPSVSIATYAASIGLAPSVDAFLAGAYQQSGTNWVSAYTAADVIKYIDAGFGF